MSESTCLVWVQRALSRWTGDNFWHSKQPPARCRGLFMINVMFTCPAKASTCRTEQEGEDKKPTKSTNWSRKNEASCVAMASFCVAMETLHVTSWLHVHTHTGHSVCVSYPGGRKNIFHYPLPWSRDEIRPQNFHPETPSEAEYVSNRVQKNCLVEPVGKGTYKLLS